MPRPGWAAHIALIGIGAVGAPILAQTTPPVVIQPPSSSENPAPPPLPAAQVPPVNVAVEPPRAGAIDPGFRLDTLAPAPLPVAPGSRAPQPGAVSLPPPTARPLEIDPSTDPILQLARNAEPADEFRRQVQHAVDLHPALEENEAYAEEARYALYQQRAAMMPSAEINLIGFQVLGREFGDNSNDNIVERTRAERRFDELATVNQLVTDFGATSRRVEAAGERLRAAALGVDTAAEQVALNTVAAWYDVYSLRTILAITEAYRADQERSRRDIEERIRQGASAPVDAALVENSLAQLDIRAARFQQQLASAEARFRELTGARPRDGLMRAPELGQIPPSLEAAREAASTTPATRAARLQARAAESDAIATRRDLLPSVSASVNAGRYGVLESPRNYDVVARITLRQRLFGGLPQRAKAAGAHADALDARARRIAEENAREAATAFSDLEALDRQLEALESAYLATLETRNATKLRFDATRGTLFDVIDASDTYYTAAVGYVQALAQRDAARYVLLARTGELLDALEIPVYTLRD